MNMLIPRLASCMQLPCLCQHRLLSLSATAAVMPPPFQGNVPPKRDRPYIDQFVPNIKIKQARKTASPSPQPHKFRPVQRSWNLREIPSTEEGWQKHEQLSPAVTTAVNKQLEEGRAGRLFAVVHVMGKQFLVKAEDIVVVTGHWPPKLGESIRLEK
ncbi:39S ribosomal protein L21, mitochondrial-like, partial [Hyalella azteca]|uniref:Large ribosomal subunit protein bL21m n=1 Tax=Hyalella azteca TaxID=294128 RepID=A0A8B7PND5_HYAAZ